MVGTDLKNTAGYYQQVRDLHGILREKDHFRSPFMRGDCSAMNNAITWMLRELSL